MVERVFIYQYILKKNIKTQLRFIYKIQKSDFKKFNYIVAPEHDSIKGNNIINSIGALHKFDKSTLDKVSDRF